MSNLFNAAPSGPPQSFRVLAISSTSIRLTWAAPLPQEVNGVITSYRITIAEIEGVEVLQQTTSASASLLVVHSLRPYYTYRCTIAAFTVAIGPDVIAEVTTFQEGSNLSSCNVLCINQNVISHYVLQHQMEVLKMQL